MAAPSNSSVYAVAYILVNGAIQFENVSVTLDQTSGSSPVKSIPGGYRGESPGSPMNEVSWESNVPLTGFEGINGTQFDSTIGGSALGGPGLQFVQFDVQMAGVNNVFNGTIYHITTSSSEGATARRTYRARGSFSPWQ